MSEQQSYPSVWTRPRRTRREQPSLSREQIVAEALRLLDAEGIGALSMRRLGSQLGSVATAIYWHVANKDELIELVVDEVFGEVKVPVAGSRAEWREAAATLARDWRAMILRHPWTVHALDEMVSAFHGPNSLRLSDEMLALFEAAGFDLLEADHAGKTLISYVLGIATSEAAALSKLARGDQSEREWIQSLWPSADEAARDHPRLRALYAAYRDADPGKNREDSFAYGLERVLDGIEARLPRS
ncbi:TetR/AcrR family transcriptional regulator [Nonomuraea sp. SBT364]|uniref:TetR/AcrR family transcriptional regulator n=1 Tax=Nonomuraea sp. SBT364 TaxID=1580530 RepID=UPI000AC43726|nr:TetR/AcrR family transcriptional regulator [Nonomuraea sp. SBT364]